MIRKHKNLYIMIGILTLIVTLLLLFKLIDNSKNIEENNVTTHGDNVFIDDDKSGTFTDLSNLSSWVVYWDLDVDNEIKQLDNELSSISYFSANFNDKNKLVIPEKLITYYNETKLYSFKKYITIVNDVVYDDGKSSLKDTNVLNEVLRDEESRKNHINEIIDLASKYEFDGIEIDYEQIKDDLDLWDNFLLFIDELYSKSILNNLDLRVMLEPNAPIEKLDFIEGPIYVMMCYNLHGAFSEPGEKANEEFIKSLIEKMKKIDGNKSFAIATGGFDWGEDGKTKSVSELEVNKILSEYDVDVQRDENSKYLYFKYMDKDNIKHEVWYADKITLQCLYKPIIEAGYNVSLWRLGGNLFNNFVGG
ncbi:glycosyl hydrolase [Clostridium nigeriense]|uniref:glycosyl hydrolase n=1 Tax=Clostridium nigeriense TaxID=1805470 RepID=UPI003D33FF04